MANLNVITKKMSNTKLKLSDLNPHLMCVLCGGYYIDATTIVECLHSFCRSCIVKHLEGSKYCPICEVQVHKTKPLINIRPDKTLQDIVYKLVPGLFANEMRKRQKFYKERPQYIKPNDLESFGEEPGERKIYINDENITFSLVYHEGPGPTSANNFYREFPPPAYNERRYFKCPTGVTIQHLKKLIKAKYELSDNNYKLEVYFRDQELQQDFTLLDVAYIYLWKTKGTLDLTYKIFENIVKRQKIEEKPERVVVNIVESKETETFKRETEDMEKEEQVKKQEEEVESEKDVKKMETEISEPEAVSKTPEIKPPEPVTTSPEPAKENGLVGTEVKEVHLQISESGVMSISQVEDSEVVGMVEETPMTVPGSQLIKARLVGQAKPGKKEKKLQDKRSTGKPPKPYKTVGCAPKTWHPFIPKEKLRPTLMKNSDEPRKPFKFFKNRNMPRFLGNPSSGVKPMFAEATVKQEDKKSDTEKIINKIIKIDPKTLRPIEKEEMKISSTPSAPNLLTNPFIPNNNHFLFSNLHLLPPNSGNYKDKSAVPGGFKAPVSNGSFPSICFPTPEHSPPGFYPFGNLTKPPTFPFPSGDKMDPLLRASRLSPFGNLAGFNVAGFHASLPPSISRLLNPHHNFRKISQSLENKSKDESTKETIKRCDDSLKKVSKVKEENEKEEVEAEAEEQQGEMKVKEGNKKEESLTTTTTTTVKEVEEEKEKEKEKENDNDKEGEVRKQEINGENDEGAPDIKSDVSASIGEKDKDKDKDR